jgi:hypothetical protein
LHDDCTKNSNTYGDNNIIEPQNGFVVGCFVAFLFQRTTKRDRKKSGTCLFVEANSTDENEKKKDDE